MVVKIRVWVLCSVIFFAGWHLNSIVTYEKSLRQKAEACDQVGCLDLVFTEESLDRSGLTEKIKPIALKGEE